jgi:hypothetical protein
VLAETVGKGRPRFIATKCWLAERVTASYSQTRAALAQLEAAGLLGVEKIGEGYVLTPLHPAILRLLEQRGRRSSRDPDTERRKTGTRRRDQSEAQPSAPETTCRKTGSRRAYNARTSQLPQEQEEPPKPPTGGDGGGLLTWGPFPARPRLGDDKRVSDKRRAELESQVDHVEVRKPARLRLLLAYVFDTVPAVEAERIAGAVWEADRNPAGLVCYRLRKFFEDERKGPRPVGRWHHPTTEPEAPKVLASPEAMLQLLVKR